MKKVKPKNIVFLLFTLVTFIVIVVVFNYTYVEDQWRSNLYIMLGFVFGILFMAGVVRVYKDLWLYTNKNSSGVAGKKG